MMAEEIEKAGGPAFPGAIPANFHEAWPGMTLRDWFAAQALCGLLQNLHVQGSFDHGVRRNAEAAYSLADAMMEARKRDPEPVEQ